ncbi:hypothetical protein HY496_01210 [Candidatus Woesearchaeota archaeon]|nr:hypothetical protein [Candidatus Woesearchaeota archaeon]
MIRLLDEIPQKQPLIYHLKGRVEEDDERLAIGGVEVPWKLVAKMRRNSRSYDCLQDIVDEKDLYLRGREQGGKIEWFGLVSDQFRPIPVEHIKEVLEGIGRRNSVRYDAQNERFQIGYTLKQSPTVMIYVDSGDFGTYGGNGESAQLYGVSIADEDPVSWTIFQNRREVERGQRAIHRASLPTINTVVRKQVDFARLVEQSWEENKTRTYTQEEIADFGSAYLHRCAAVFDGVLAQMNGSITGEQLIATLHEEARRYSSRKQFGLEALAGDLVMYGKPAQEPQKQESTKQEQLRFSFG